jgi:hypothetical protein
LGCLAVYEGSAAGISGVNERGRLATRKDSMSDDPQFMQAIGHAALGIWSDLPRDLQERLFEDAVGDDAVLRRRLALYLHNRHPRTAHPPSPTAFA